MDQLSIRKEKKSSIKRLNTVHNEALRLCTGAFRSSPIQSLYVEAEEPPLDLRRLDLSTRYYTRTISNPNFQNTSITDNQHDHLFHANVNLKKPIGMTARSTITEYLQDHDIMKIPEKTIAPWNLKDIKICTKGSKYNKNTNQLIQKLEFLEHLDDFHRGNSHIYTDGSKTSQGVGFAAVLHSKTIKGTLHKETSIYTAELTAICY